jgi:radical SAM-linked protein
VNAVDNQGFRLRISFAKRGALRYLSHLEVSRAFERLIRRSGLPYKISQGFNPHIKHAFGPALPVGTVGLREQLDLELSDFVKASDALAQLKAVAPCGLLPLECKYVGSKAPSLNNSLTLAFYEIELAVGELSAAELEQHFATLRNTGELKLLKKGKEKAYNLEQIILQTSVGASIARPHENGNVATIDTSLFCHSGLDPETTLNIDN